MGNRDYNDESTLKISTDKQMLSTDLKTYGFSNWFPIEANQQKNKELILRLPKKKGIYVIRLSKPVPRIKGESDIIYIGQGIIRHRIQALFRSYLPLPFRDYMNKHTAREMFERVTNELNLQSQFSYVLRDQESKELESRLLIDYRLSHIEPPPLNCTRK
jgi:hypothetical protein